jgi:hypothetical protein
VHSVGPDLARGYSPQGAAACYARLAERLAGPRRTHGAVTARSSRARCRGGTLVGDSVAVGRWQGATGELVRGPQGGRRARRSWVELTRATTRRGGSAGCFGQRRSSAGRELRWLVAMEARPYSVDAEEGR